MTRAARLAAKVGATLVVTALSTVFFGFSLPMVLLASKLLPHLGLASLLYVYGGGLLGLLVGGVSTAVSLARTEGLFTPYVARFGAGLVAGNLAALALAVIRPDLFAHL